MNTKEKKLRVISVDEGIEDATPVPTIGMRGFARATIRAVEKHFKNPAVQKDFERWLREDYALRPGVELSEVYKNG